MPHLVCEYDFDPPLGDEDYRSAFNALKPCLDVRGIRRLRSWLSEDRKRGICEYEAADMQSLRDAYRAASVPFARIWSGKLFEFGVPSSAGP
jgi:hypothetical protein